MATPYNGKGLINCICQQAKGLTKIVICIRPVFLFYIGRVSVRFFAGMAGNVRKNGKNSNRKQKDG